MTIDTRPFIPYARQSIDASDIQAVEEALKNGVITRGERVAAFEQAIADYCGAQYAVAFNSATTALIAACHAIDANPADRLITTPNTFVASVNAGYLRGVIPQFIDIDPNTGNLSLEKLGEVLKEFKSSRGRSIILPVHFSGIPVDMQQIDRQIRTPEAIVIEDAAHALGSIYPNGQRVGCCAWSQMTIFSFHPAKTITTGEGGLVTTNDQQLYHRLRRFRDNGIERDPAYLRQDLAEWYPGYYEMVEMTGNFNFTDFQAALGLSQLKRAEEFVRKRRSLMAVYRRMLASLPDVRLFVPESDESSACHLFVIQIDFSAYNTTRKHVMTQLRELGIGTQVHYIPVYKHPFYEERLGSLATSENFPEMERYFSQALTLPLYYDLQENEIHRIVNALKDLLVEERQKMHRKHRRK